MTITIPETRLTGDLITAALYNEIIIAIEHILTMQVDGGNLASAIGNKALGWDIGDLKASARLGDIDNRWLICDGRTIGNASSGATARANADMERLYVYLWENVGIGQLVIQNSSGVDTTRGASALADFSANKRLPLFNLKGRTIAGIDPDDVALSFAWSKLMGGFGGFERHRLLVSEMPIHTHNPATGTTILQGIASGGSAGLAAGSTVTSSASTASAGADGEHNNVQPTMAFNYFIYTGL
jgi:hypothetical protein